MINDDKYDVSEAMGTVLDAKRLQHESKSGWAIMPKDLFRFPLFIDSSRIRGNKQEYQLTLHDGLSLHARTDYDASFYYDKTARLTHLSWLIFMHVCYHFCKYRTSTVLVEHETFLELCSLHKVYEKPPFRIIRQHLHKLSNTRISIHQSGIDKFIDVEQFTLLESCKMIKRHGKVIGYEVGYSRKLMEHMNDNGAWFMMSTKAIAILNRFNRKEKLAQHIYALIQSKTFKTSQVNFELSWEDLTPFDTPIRRGNRIITQNSNPLALTSKVGRAFKFLEKTKLIKSVKNNKKKQSVSITVMNDKEIRKLPLIPNDEGKQGYCIPRTKYSMIDTSLVDENKELEWQQSETEIEFQKQEALLKSVKESPSISDEEFEKAKGEQLEMKMFVLPDSQDSEKTAT